MARCGVRFSAGSTTRRQTNGSAVHQLVLCIIGQWTHQPREWTRVRFVSLCLVQCGLAIRQESPGPDDLGASTPVHCHMKSIIEHHSHLLYDSGYYTHHMRSHSEILHFTTECVCVCVSVCVCVMYCMAFVRHRKGRLSTNWSQQTRTAVLDSQSVAMCLHVLSQTMRGTKEGSHAQPVPILSLWTVNTLAKSPVLRIVGKTTPCLYGTSISTAFRERVCNNRKWRRTDWRKLHNRLARAPSVCLLHCATVPRSEKCCYMSVRRSVPNLSASEVQNFFSLSDEKFHSIQRRTLQQGGKDIVKKKLRRLPVL